MKLLEIEGVPNLAVCEIRDDDHQGVIPLAAGFYIYDPANGGSAVSGPYTTAAAAARAARDGRILETLVREGAVRLKAEDGMMRFEAVEMPDEALERALQAAADALRAEDLAVR
jgi:hypothetical protein